MSGRYTSTARYLHWLVAIGVFVQISLGFAADWTRDAVSDLLLDAHVQVGLGILALMILRLLWRLAHPPPPLPHDIAAWQRRFASWGHRLLYVLLIVMPVSGYLLWMWIGRSLAFAGLAPIPIPDLAGQDEFWRSLAGYIHEYAGYALFALLGAHIGAALWHELVEGQRIIRDRML